MSACCGPARNGRPDESRAAPAVPASRRPARAYAGMVAIPGGSYRIGGDDDDAFADDGEGPVRTVQVRPFLIDPVTVTNRQFATFVKQTGYVSDADRFGWSFVFHSLVHPGAGAAVREGTVREAPWWRAVDGATWRSPEGPGSTVGERPNHPVVHVSWADADAFARWAGKRLPTEAEWEIAARGGLVGARFPWGDELMGRGRPRCNIWQGGFPDRPAAPDRIGAVPVNAFAPNGYGLYNCSGNVWEWCADWWSTTWHGPDSPVTRVDPSGPDTGQSRAMRGGSYLCHDSYCNRYRVSARTHNTPDSSTGHVGFRCAADVE